MSFRFIFPILVVVSCGVAGCTDRNANPSASTSPAEASPITGGWQATAVNEEVRQAADFALQSMGKSGVGIRAIIDPRNQVVAGMNFAMTLELNDGTKWQVVVFRALDGKMHMTRSSRM